MDLNIGEDRYENLTEIYVIGENAVEVATINGRTFRVYAKETVRGPHTFSATYDELVRGTFNVENDPDNEHLVWIRAHNMPWEQGNTMEGCIRSALHWVNERGN